MIEKLEDQERGLLKAALDGMKNAYIISGFAVGAAALATDGRIYQGCNVESQIADLGICAERCAIDHAVLHGNKRIKKIALLYDREVRTLRPCGACLQYISDFSEGEARIVMAKVKNGKILPNSIEVRTIKEMFPYRFEI